MVGPCRARLLLNHGETVGVEDRSALAPAVEIMYSKTMNIAKEDIVEENEERQRQCKLIIESNEKP